VEVGLRGLELLDYARTMPILGKGQFFLVGCELADGISQIAAIGDGVAIEHAADAPPIFMMIPSATFALFRFLAPVLLVPSPLDLPPPQPVKSVIPHAMNENNPVHRDHPSSHSLSLFMSFSFLLWSVPVGGFTGGQIFWIPGTRGNHILPHRLHLCSVITSRYVTLPT